MTQVFIILESSEGFRFAIISLFLHVAEKVVSLSTLYYSTRRERLVVGNRANMHLTRGIR